MPKKLKCTHPMPGLGLLVGDVETFDNARAKELLAVDEAGRASFTLEADLGADRSDNAPDGEAYNAELLAKRAADAQKAKEDAAATEAAEEVAAEKAANEALEAAKAAKEAADKAADEAAAAANKATDDAAAQKAADEAKAAATAKAKKADK